jgi:CDP-2,3-bis-(O-geranylgeranyl)-sn-glycerol synthase
MESLTLFIVSCVYFFLPAYFANMAPPLAKRAGIFKSLFRPIDGGKRLGGEPVFGDHKTWLGALAAMSAGFAVFSLQEWLCRFPGFLNISIIDYGASDACLVALLMPLGTVLGDLGSAFTKRRLKLKPGAKFIPWDQTNYVIGNFIILQPMLNLNLNIWFTLFVLTFFLHVIFNRLGYILGLHKAKW